MKISLVIYSLLLLTPLNSFAIIKQFDDRIFYLHADNNELTGFKWGHFLSCLKTVKMGNDNGPRKLDMDISRLVITTIDEQLWLFSIKEDDSKVILESVTLNTTKYYSLKEKRRLFLKIVGNCDIQTNS